MVKKEITIAAGEQEFKFNVTTTEYNLYVNEMKMDDKVAPSKRFLTRCLADANQREALNSLCDQGLAVDLAGLLIEEFRPKLELEIKK